MFEGSFLYLCPNCAEYHQFSYKLIKGGIDEYSINGPEVCRTCGIKFDPEDITDKLTEKLMKEFYAN